MFHVIAKLFWLFCAPANLIVWLILGAALLIILGRRHTAAKLVLTAAALALLFAALPLGDMLLRPLEDEYPRQPLPAHIQGILVLGGGLKSSILHSRGTLGEDEGIERLVAAYDLARLHPEARVIFSGGRGGLATPLPEAFMAGYVWRNMGLDPKRLTLESRSRDTWENLLYSRALAHPKPQNVWVLATSAYHLPR
ncbi:MAG: YdcF family protein, partial [Alphaproteobacteria bacterium]|nr:YdcF family protein [Alphaproteobacteria bacterium]